MLEKFAAVNVVGVFIVFQSFTPDKIGEWVDDGACASCPYCGIDSVIGSASGYPITQEFLQGMKAHWF